MFSYPAFPFRGALQSLGLIGLTLVITVCGGSGTDEATCTVTGVTVQPNQVTLTLGESTTLTAQVTSTNCNPAPVVTWNSSNPSQVSLQVNGNQAVVTGDALTTLRADLAAVRAPVTVTAGAGTPVHSGSSQVTVDPAPAIAFNTASLSFNAVEGDPSPAPQGVTITNSGGGILAGLGVGTITYGAGASGWLQTPVLSSTTAGPTATLTIEPITGALTAGTYTATVPVTATSASNSPQNITVTFTVISATPVIALSSNALTFNATVGGADPASQAVDHHEQRVRHVERSGRGHHYLRRRSQWVAAGPGAELDHGQPVGHTDHPADHRRPGGRDLHRHRPGHFRGGLEQPAGRHGDLHGGAGTRDRAVVRQPHLQRERGRRQSGEPGGHHLERRWGHAERPGHGDDHLRGRRFELAPGTGAQLDHRQPDGYAHHSAGHRGPRPPVPTRPRSRRPRRRRRTAPRTSR